jgi:hypothetical protein
VLTVVSHRGADYGIQVKIGCLRWVPGDVQHIRRTIGEYHFAGQYQQSPAPLGGGLVKAEWFKRYPENELPERFDRIVQSWDTANKATELSDFSVCTSWGVKGNTSSSSVCSVGGSNTRR